MNPASAIVLYPGGRRPKPVQPVAPSAPVAPATAVPWDREQLITAGFSTPTQWHALTGIWRDVRAVVWHDMEGFLAGSLARWNTGVAGAHLCILRDGTVVLTCDLRHVAWHAGTGNDQHSDTFGRTEFWRRVNVNAHSVGIELEGFASTGYTDAQAAASRRVADWLTAKYGILRNHTFDAIDGHHAHGELSASRSDPGPLFSWDWVL
jgi:N-acetyl-anhydromuramyl-L-alanine amidase AmpD